jgi:hypothetical protein
VLPSARSAPVPRSTPVTGGSRAALGLPPLLHHTRLDLGRASALPRKEVIQPQLPLRLPCYDFVPITHPTLDGCLPEGLAHRLQVLPAFMT